MINDLVKDIKREVSWQVLHKPRVYELVDRLDDMPFDLSAVDRVNKTIYLSELKVLYNMYPDKFIEDENLVSSDESCVLPSVLGGAWDTYLRCRR